MPDWPHYPRLLKEIQKSKLMRCCSLGLGNSMEILLYLPSNLSCRFIWCVPKVKCCVALYKQLHLALSFEAYGLSQSSINHYAYIQDLANSFLICIHPFWCLRSPIIVVEGKGHILHNVSYETSIVDCTCMLRLFIHRVLNLYPPKWMIQ